MGKRRGAAGKIPWEQCAIVGVNIRTLRQRGVDPGEARRADGLAKRLHRVRRRRPPRRPAARFHRRGNQAAGRDLRRLPFAAHDAVRELRRPSASRVRLPGLWSHARQGPVGYVRSCLPGAAGSSGGVRMSTRVKGATVLVTVTAHATLSAGPVHFSLSAREGPAPGTWRYNLNDGKDARAATGRVAGMTDHMDVLRYVAGISAAGYEPGTVERGLLEQFAAGDMG